MFNTTYRRADLGTQSRSHNEITAMTRPALLISIFGLLVLGGGIIEYSDTDTDADNSSLAFIIATVILGLGLLAGGYGVFLRKDLALVFAPFLTLVNSALFGAHLVVTGEVFPAGAMVMLGLAALVVFYRALPSKETL